MLTFSQAVQATIQDTYNYMAASGQTEVSASAITQFAAIHVGSSEQTLTVPVCQCVMQEIYYDTIIRRNSRVH